MNGTLSKLWTECHCRVYTTFGQLDAADDDPLTAATLRIHDHIHH
jgi:hypothetical protein